MLKGKKSKFPQIKKKIKSFLTDESGKITKKNALGISLGAGALSLGEEASAGWGHHSGADHTNGSWYGAHANVITGAHQSGFTSASCQHVSGIINGHMSSTPTATTSGHASGRPVSGHGSHSSHASHGNHENGGWC